MIFFPPPLARRCRLWDLSSWIRDRTQAAEIPEFWTAGLLGNSLFTGIKFFLKKWNFLGWCKTRKNGANYTFLKNQRVSRSVVSDSVTPWACQAPQSMGFSRLRMPEWVPISFSRGCFRPRDPTLGLRIASRLLGPEPLYLHKRNIIIILRHFP